MSKYLKSQDFTQEWGGAGSPSLPYIDGKLGVVANYAICERAYYNIGLMGSPFSGFVVGKGALRRQESFPIPRGIDDLAPLACIFETSSQLTPPSRGESTNHRFRRRFHGLVFRVASGDILRAHAVRVIIVDEPEGAGQPATGWRSMLAEQTDDLPIPDLDQPALLSWTSGTTGSAKAFLLTHRNIATNVEALLQLAVVGPDDRALLPLPLHHAYPFIVGMLTTLTIGTAIVLPGDTTGPQLMRAMREGEVTTIIGVPRLYDALWMAIETRVTSRGTAVRLIWRALLKSASLVQQSTGLPFGRLLFAPIRRSIAARLRLLVSGGARLEQETEDRLEALGLTVLSGYGLAETASLFTGNRPGARRSGSVGRPLAGEVRITQPDEGGIGEIELHGSSITEGYLDNPEANREAFTPDGWYRTGDLGLVDRDGFLFVTGRVKEVLVLGGGKKVIPEDLERSYGGAPEIAEVAVLEDRGALVALVRPEAAKLRERGVTNLRDGIRIVLGEKARGLPSWQRLSGFALTDQPMPRTRLGKYRRFLLPALYSDAVAGGARRVAHALTPQDAALCASRRRKRFGPCCASVTRTSQSISMTTSASI